MTHGEFDLAARDADIGERAAVERVQLPDGAALLRRGNSRDSASQERAESVLDQLHDVSGVGWRCPAPFRSDRVTAVAQTGDPPERWLDSRYRPRMKGQDLRNRLGQE